MADQVAPEAEAECSHMLSWLKPAAAEGRGSTGAMLIRCAGCRQTFRGPTAFMVVVKAFQDESTETRREFFALQAKVKQALKDLAFLEQAQRDPELAQSIQQRLRFLERYASTSMKQQIKPIVVKEPKQS